MMVCACKTSTQGEQGEEGPQVQGQPGLCSKASAQKKRKRKKRRRKRKKKASMAILGEMVMGGGGALLPPPPSSSSLYPHTPGTLGVWTISLWGLSSLPSCEGCVCVVSQALFCFVLSSERSTLQDILEEGYVRSNTHIWECVFSLSL